MESRMNKWAKSKCLFCRKPMLKKDFHYCKEVDCPMGEMCEDCAIEHKKAHQREKDYSINLMENIISGICVKDNGNNTFL